MALTKNDIVQILSYTVFFLNAIVLNHIFMKYDDKSFLKPENAIL